MAAFTWDTAQIRGNKVLVISQKHLEWYLQYPVKYFDLTGLHMCSKSL